MTEWDNVLLTLLVVVLTSCLVYDKIYLEYLKDVHELALAEQASISSTRRQGESAIYRSLDVMHGLPLTVGLQVRYDIYKIRNGNLKDVWSLAMDKGENKITFINEGGDRDSITFEELNNILYKISLELKRLPNEKKVAIYSSLNNQNALLVILSSFFYTNRTIKNLTKIPQLKNDDIGIICCDSKELNTFKKLGYERFLLLDEDSDDSSVQSITVSKLLQDKGLQDTSKFEYTFAKEDDFQTAFVDTVNFKEIEYSQVNFVSSIASQLRSLPMEHMWQADDTLMVETADHVSSSTHHVLLNQNFLIKLLSAFVAGIHEIYIVTEKNCDISLIQETSPSILSVSEKVLHHNLGADIGKQIEKLGLIQYQAFKLSSHWFSRGIHNSLFKHSSIPQLRLIYSEVYAEPQLSSLLLNYMQSALSSRLIVERFKIPLLGPILKTNFFDYRLLENDTDSDNRLLVKKLGIPANCLEFKVKDSGVYKAESKEGELMCRGFNIGRELVQRVNQDDAGGDAEGWMPVGIIGKWGEDGCFYEYI